MSRQLEFFRRKGQEMAYLISMEDTLISVTTLAVDEPPALPGEPTPEDPHLPPIEYWLPKPIEDPQLLPAPPQAVPQSFLAGFWPKNWKRA